MDTNSVLYKSLYPLYKSFISRKQKADDDSAAIWEEAYIDVVRLAKQSEMEGGRIGISIKALDSGRTISYNSSSVFDIASVIKIVVMAGAYSAIETFPGKFTPEDRARIDVLTLRMIRVSDNVARHELVKMLQDKFGNDYFYNYCKKTGLANTSLKCSSPGDVALLLEKLYKSELFRNPDMSRKCIDLLKQNILDNRIPRYLPAEIQKNIAHKTGTAFYNNNYWGLKIVCHDTGIVYSPKGDFIICVMIEYNVDDGKDLTPQTPTMERGIYIHNKMKELLPKGTEIIRRISATIYYNCIEKRPKLNPKPLL